VVKGEEEVQGFEGYLLTELERQLRVEVQTSEHPIETRRRRRRTRGGRRRERSTESAMSCW